MRLTSCSRGLVLCLAAVACASSQLATSADHPASPAAAAAPLPSVGTMLVGAEPPPTAPPPDGGAHPSSHQGHDAPGAPAHAAEEAGEAGTEEKEAQKQQWTCPMHPEILRSEPGSCPICHMKLVPVKPKPDEKKP